MEESVPTIPGERVGRKFERHLSDKFLLDIRRDGPCATVFRECLNAELDARLRGSYISLYFHGRSLAKIHERKSRPSKLSIHHKYTCAGRVGDCIGRNSGDYIAFDVDETFADAYVANLNQLIERAQKHVGPEEKDEGHLLKSNGIEAAVCCFDRQIQVSPERRRFDLVGLLSGNDPALVLIEVKRYPDPSIQDVSKQLSRYLEVLDPKQKGLRKDVACSYRTMCEQLRALDLPAPEPMKITPGMPVKGLAIVSNYNSRSELLGRARSCATQLERPMYLWQPERNEYLIPTPERWELMGRER